MAALPGREAEFRAGCAAVLNYLEPTGLRWVHLPSGAPAPGIPLARSYATYLENLRHEVALPMIRQILVQRSRDGERAIGGEIERIAIGRRPCCKLGADHTASARTVVDDQLMPPELRKLGAEQAHDNVACPTCRIGQHEADRAIGKLLRSRGGN